MRACVIFNPAARGEKARHCRRFLDTLGSRAELMPTTGPGTARALSRSAVESGHSLIFAAGGDGTVFEVLNGIADVPEGLERAALGVLPLGTANVLAHELGLPSDPARACQLLDRDRGRLRRIDCGVAEFQGTDGHQQRAHFAIVAGAGLDARAVQLVDWRMKRRTGKLAYVLAACRALFQYPDRVRCRLGGTPFDGRAILAGNGRFYAGEIPVFGDGALDSGRLHLRGVRSVGPVVLLRCLMAYATGRWPLGQRLPADAVVEARLEADRPVPLQLDGEFAGWLPATLRVRPGALQVLVPFTGEPAAPPSRPPA